MSVPHALLALLSEGPKYGLRLQSEFESRTGEVWPLNVGQVYTTLQRLERDGLVETDDGEGERSQKRYRITSAGARELADWLRTPPDLVPPPRDELVIKVLVRSRSPGSTSTRSCRCTAGTSIEVMQRYTRIKAAAAEDDVRLALVADAELFRLEAIVRWLDAADVRLKQLPATAPAAAADAASRTNSHDGGLAMTSALELRQVSKVYGSGPSRGARAPRGRPLGRARRARGGHGAERLRQEHALDDRRQPRGADAAARCSWTASTSRPSRARIGRGCDAGRSATCSRTSTCSRG